MTLLIACVLSVTAAVLSAWREDQGVWEVQVLGGEIECVQGTGDFLHSVHVHHTI